MTDLEAFDGPVRAEMARMGWEVVQRRDVEGGSCWVCTKDGMVVYLSLTCQEMLQNSTDSTRWELIHKRCRTADLTGRNLRRWPRLTSHLVTQKMLAGAPEQGS